MQDEYAKRIMRMMTEAVTEYDDDNIATGEVVGALAQAYIRLTGVSGFLDGEAAEEFANEAYKRFDKTSSIEAFTFPDECMEPRFGIHKDVLLASAKHQALDNARFRSYTRALRQAKDAVKVAGSVLAR